MTQIRGGADRSRRSILSLLAPLILAAVLTGAAVVTIDRAGCDDPGRYVETDGGVELVGGCVSPGAVHRSVGQDGDMGDAGAAEQRG